MTKLFSEVFDLKPTRGMTREELARLLAQGAAVSNCRLKSKSAAESRRIKGSAVWKQPLLGAVARVRRIKFRTPKIRHICHGFDLYKTVSVALYHISLTPRFSEVYGQVYCRNRFSGLLAQ